METSSTQLTLWQEEAPECQVQGAELLGATVRTHSGHTCTVAAISAYTEEWGAMYRLHRANSPYPHLAYASEFTAKKQMK